MTYKVMAVSDGFVITNTYLEIANNVIGNIAAVMNQQYWLNIGPSTSRTIYGNGSWIPTVSLDSTTYTTATRFYFQIRAKRGTNNNYTDNWKRPFV